MQHPFFSIIVPVYKVEKYLSRFLESVASQTFIDYEVLLVDDGSPDSSGAICDEFSASHSGFRTIHKPNGGVSSARNRGIEEANGEWLLFFDSDDVVAPETLEKVYEAILQTPPTECVIYAYKEVMNDGKSFLRSLPVEAPSVFDIERMRTDILPYFAIGTPFLNSPWSKAFKRRIIKDSNLQFRKRVRGEDWLFCLEYFRKISCVCTIPDYLYMYMRNDDSAMSKYCPEQFQLWAENWESKLSLARDFQLNIDKPLMLREMMVKLYYFIVEVSKFEPEVSRRKKIYDILHTPQFKEWISAHPTSLREWIAKVRLLWWHYTVKP